jgi:hypothetical protein
LYEEGINEQWGPKCNIANKVYEGEKNLENSEVHMKTELHISRNNTPGTLVNKTTNINTEKISLAIELFLRRKKCEVY